MLEAFTTSTAIVALAEIGDKTQLLAIVLAARFKRPAPIVLGILAATLANHFLAALLGATAAAFLDGMWFRLAIAVGFVAMGLWTLVPDKLDDDDARLGRPYGPFVATTIAFFIAEMGDKTQVATVMLAAQYPEFVLVILGTTVGMLLANVPVVLVSHFAADRLPLTLIRRVAAGGFAALAVYAAYQAVTMSTIVSG